MTSAGSRRPRSSGSRGYRDHRYGVQHGEWFLNACVAALRLRRAQDATKPQVTRRGVDRLRHARRGSVTAAVVGCAKVRASLHHLARNPGPGCCRVVRLRRIAATARVVDRAAGLPYLAVVLVPVGGPFPHVARHLVQAVSVGRKRDRGCLGCAGRSARSHSAVDGLRGSCVPEVAPGEERQSRRCSRADGRCIGLAVRGNLNADRLGQGCCVRAVAL
jgi:hypothetical protein